MKPMSSRIIALTLGLMLPLAMTAGNAAGPEQTEPVMRSGTIDEVDFANDSIIINDRSYQLPANAVIHLGKRQVSRQSLTRGMRVEFSPLPTNGPRPALTEMRVLP